MTDSKALKSTPKIMLVAGEASGDLHGASLVNELKSRGQQAEFVAMGGDNLRRCGVEMLVDNRELAVIGLFEVIKHYPVIRRALKQLEDYLRESPPDLLILIDYVEFNLKLAKTAKSLGIKVLFYVSPQVWAWRQGRVKKIGKRIDMMAVIFPFEVAFYEKHGVPVRYVGNPLVGKVKATRTREENLQRFGLDPPRPVVGLQPGSRRSEIARLLPLFLEAAELLIAERPEIQLVIPVAASIDKNSIEDAIPADLEVILTNDELPYDTMQVCDAILTASGTATLETALMQAPMTVAYRVSPASYKLLKHLIKIPHIALANIVAGRGVVKEHIQDAAEPQALKNELLRLLEDQPYRTEVKTGLLEVREKLGELKGTEEMGRLVIEILANECEELNAIS